MFGRLVDCVGYLNLDILADRVVNATCSVKDSITSSTKIAVYDASYGTLDVGLRIKDSAKKTTQKVKDSFKKKEVVKEVIKDNNKSVKAEEVKANEPETKDTVVESATVEEVVEVVETKEETAVAIDNSKTEEPELQPGVIYGMDFSGAIIKEAPIIEKKEESEQPKAFIRTGTQQRGVTIEDTKKLIIEDERNRLEGKNKKKK